MYPLVPVLTTERSFSKPSYRNIIQMKYMGVCSHGLPVMKSTTTTPNPVYGIGQLLAATAVLFGAVLLLFVALEYPLVVGGLLVTTFVTAAVTTVALDYRRRLGRTRHVCIPKTKLCIDA